MRLGIVRGHVTLNPAVAAYRGKTLVVLEPVTMENLNAGNGLGGGQRGGVLRLKLHHLL